MGEWVGGGMVCVWHEVGQRGGAYEQGVGDVAGRGYQNWQGFILAKQNSRNASLRCYGAVSAAKSIAAPARAVAAPGWVCWLAKACQSEQLALPLQARSLSEPWVAALGSRVSCRAARMIRR